MGWTTFTVFGLLALGYAALGFLVGREILHSVLQIEPIEYLPMPGLVLQAIGFGLVFVVVIGSTKLFVQVLSLDKM